ncbi:MAG: helix-turn-helix domain-containing protein [Burkholderiales bacterium]|nr:helix-turn-helix domain-containing protein [Burkholderiales bacterium]
MTTAQNVSPFPSSGAAAQNQCSSCPMKKLCMPAGLSDAQMQMVEQVVCRRRRVAAGGHLFRMGDPFTNLYVVSKGHFKTDRISEGGMQQITGFQMNGEMLGLDAIGSDRHSCDAIALENSEVCEIPFARFEKLFVEIPSLLRHFYRLMSREIEREQGAMLLLGSMNAEQRVAAFLVDIAIRYEDRGNLISFLQLPMSREDIGNHLGLTIESISRTLSKLKKKGWLKVHNRDLEILDFVSLESLAGGLDPEERGGRMVVNEQRRSTDSRAPFWLVGAAVA